MGVSIFHGSNEKSSDKRHYRLYGKVKEQWTFSSTESSYTSSLMLIPIQITSSYNRFNTTRVTYEPVKHNGGSNKDSSETRSKKPSTFFYPSIEFSQTSSSMLIPTQTTSSNNIPKMTRVTYKPINHYDVSRRPVESIKKAKNNRPVGRIKKSKTANNERHKAISSFDSFKIGKNWKLKYMGGKLHGLKAYESRKLYTSDPYKSK